MSDVFTEEQIKEFREVFNLFDKNEEGTIPSEDLGTVMRSLAQTPTDEEIKYMINKVDPDGNGTINFEDLLNVLSRNMTSGSAEDAIYGAFRQLDKDKDGYIEAKDLREVLTTLGEKLTDEEVDELIATADKLGNGMIDYKDFIKDIMLA